MIRTDERLFPPVMISAQETYEEGEPIELECRAPSTGRTGPKPTIRWLIDDKHVST